MMAMSIAAVGIYDAEFLIGDIISYLSYSHIRQIQIFICISPQRPTKAKSKLNDPRRCEDHGGLLGDSYI